MPWSPQQDAALVKAARWVKEHPKQVFRIFGYAGTGKTTLARHLAAHVEGHVCFGAYTGKAAAVLRAKGCANATTIHSLIYQPKEKGRARLRSLEEALLEARAKEGQERIQRLERAISEERKALSQPAFALNLESEVRDAALIVIDECSMVDERIGADLESFGVPILVLGDPAQLPPVRGGGYFTGCKPDVMLTEIHRQARDNPIIHLATKTRERNALAFGQYGASSVIPRIELNAECALNAGQILVGRNATRRAMNRRLRQLLHRASWAPEPGDRLVCCRNNHELGLLNGTLWDVCEAEAPGEATVELAVRPSGEPRGQPLYVDAHVHYFQGRDADLPWWERKEAEEFDYGYALTTHKAQGSQWPDVVIMDESACFRGDEWRWLYTALTRAAETVTVAR